MPPDLSGIRAFAVGNLDAEIHSDAQRNPVQAPRTLGSRFVVWLKETFSSGAGEARQFKTDTINAIRAAYGPEIANEVIRAQSTRLNSVEALTGRDVLSLVRTAESFAAKRLQSNVVNARKFAEDFVRETAPGVGGMKRPLTLQEQAFVRQVTTEIGKMPGLMSGKLSRTDVYGIANTIQLQNQAPVLPGVPPLPGGGGVSLGYSVSGRPRRDVLTGVNPGLDTLSQTQPGVTQQFEKDFARLGENFTFTDPLNGQQQELGGDLNTAHANLLNLCGNNPGFATRVSKFANTSLLVQGVEIARGQMEARLGGGTLGGRVALPEKPSFETHIEQLPGGNVKVTLRNVTGFQKLSVGGEELPLDPTKNFVSDEISFEVPADPTQEIRLLSHNTTIFTELPHGFTLTPSIPPGGEPTITSAGLSIDQATANAQLTGQPGPVELALGDAMKTPELLEQFPTGGDVKGYVTELETHREVLRSRLQSLQLYRSSDTQTGRLTKALRTELREQIRQIDNHLKYVQRPTTGPSTSRARLSNQVYMLGQGMALHLRDLYNTRKREGASFSELTKIENLRKQIENQSAQILDTEQNNTAPVQSAKQEVKRMSAGLKLRYEEGLRSIGFEPPSEKLQTRYFNLALSTQQSWQPYSKQVTLFGQQFTSKITPASKMDHLREQYGEIEGVPAGDKFESHHSTNLAHTELTDQNGVKLFEGERHGVLSAWGISDPVERRQANRSRAMEVVKSAFTNDTNLLNQALLNPGQPIDLPISSISLLTPDWFRTGDGNERAMLRDQSQAWEDVSGLQTIQIRNPANGQMVDVQVNVQPMVFNFGVNQGGVSSTFGIESDGVFGSRLLGWSMADEMNERGLKVLLGDDLDPTQPPGGLIGQEIARLQLGTPQERTKAIHMRTLSDQIRTLWQDQSHRRDEGEAYKMVSRLALLTHMSGVKVAFNCKSGKDRTGNLDTEVKFLAGYIQANNAVPPIGHQLTVPQQTDLFNLSEQGGSRYMQELNTGVEGYKLKGVQSVVDRIGGQVPYRQFLGASDSTHE